MDSENLFHFLEISTQTPDVARQQIESGEIWGREVDFWGQPPRVKAYAPGLPDDAIGIESTTGVLPDRGSPPGYPTWSPERPRVRLEGGYAKLTVTITHCTQQVSGGDASAVSSRSE